MIRKETPTNRDRMTIDEICEVAQMRVVSIAPDTFPHLIYQLAMVVRDHLAGSNEARCSATTTETKSGDPSQCILNCGHKQDHAFPVWDKVDDAVAKAGSLPAEPAWNVIQSECGTTPAAWARAFLQAQDAGGAKFAASTVVQWFQHAMDETWKKCQKKANAALTERMTLVINDIRKALDQADGTPWWDLVTQVSKQNAQIDRLIKEREDCTANHLKNNAMHDKERTNLIARCAHLTSQLRNEELVRAEAIKLHKITQDQIDKFMSVCADQAIQIMELRQSRGEKTVIPQELIDSLSSDD